MESPPAPPVEEVLQASGEPDPVGLEILDWAQMVAAIWASQEELDQSPVHHVYVALPAGDPDCEPAARFRDRVCTSGRGADPIPGVKLAAYIGRWLSFDR